MIKVLLIVTKNGTKYQFGIDKSVSKVVKEIEDCDSNYYQVVDTCAIKVSEIVSVEQFDYNPKQEGKEND